jgi:hypothetical protein
MSLNTNQAKPNNFLIRIIDPENDEVKNINFMIQDTSIPSLTLNATQANYQSHSGAIPDVKINYDQLNIQLILNDDWSNYFYLHDWLIRLREAENFLDELKTIQLLLLNNNKLPIKQIDYMMAFPVLLGDIPLMATSIDATPVVINVAFAYQFFNLIKIV